MKKTINTNHKTFVRVGAWLSCAVAGVGLLLVSCSKEPAETITGGDGSASPVIPSAALSVDIGSRADLSGAVEGQFFGASLDKVFAVTAYRGSAAPTTDFSGPYFSNQAVNSGTIPQGGTSGPALSFANSQYYPANGDKLFFYAYSPVTGGTYTEGTSSVAPKVSWTLTGQQDIMAAQVTGGICKVGVGETQGQPAFAFAHKLKQVKFKIRHDNSTFEDNIALDKLVITGAKKTATMDLSSGAVTFGTDTCSFTVYDKGEGSGIAITATAAEAGSAVMFEAGRSFTFQATAGGVTYNTVTVDLGENSGTAGTSYTVTLTFQRSAIVPAATVTAWVQGSDNNDVNIQ